MPEVNTPLSADEPTSLVVDCPVCKRVMWFNSTHETHGVLDRPSDAVLQAQPEIDANYKGNSEDRRRARR